MGSYNWCHRFDPQRSTVCLQRRVTERLLFVQKETSGLKTGTFVWAADWSKLIYDCPTSRRARVSVHGPEGFSCSLTEVKPSFLLWSWIQMSVLWTDVSTVITPSCGFFFSHTCVTVNCGLHHKRPLWKSGSPCEGVADGTWTSLREIHKSARAAFTTSPTIHCNTEVLLWFENTEQKELLNVWNILTLLNHSTTSRCKSTPAAWNVRTWRQWTRHMTSDWRWTRLDSAWL